jgi:hypothetical protein
MVIPPSTPGTRGNATRITGAESSHLPMFSKPKEVVKGLESAAKEEVAMGTPE